MTDDIVFPQGMSGFISATDKTKIDRLHLILLGEPGSGKSRVVTTGRKPIIVWDHDDRSESIAGINGVWIKTLKDLDQTSPHAWADMEADVATLEYEFSQNKALPFKTVSVDSLTFALRHAHNQLMQDQASLCRTLKINGRSYRIPQGWDAINGAQAMLLGLINRLFALKVDVIVTAHTRKEKAPDWTEENPTFTSRYTIDPQNLKMLLPAFNERWFMTDDFNVITKPNYDCFGVTAMNIDSREEGNIEKILRKHEENTQRGLR